MADDSVEPLGDFEVWLLRRVAQAVEAAEVSADLLLELQAVPLGGSLKTRGKRPPFARWQNS